MKPLPARTLNRLLRRRAAEAGHEVPLARRVGGDENLDVFIRKSGGFESRGHRFGGRRTASGRLGGVDADELLVDVVREPPRLVTRGRHGRAHFE